MSSDKSKIFFVDFKARKLEGVSEVFAYPKLATRAELEAMNVESYKKALEQYRRAMDDENDFSPDDAS